MPRAGRWYRLISLAAVFYENVQQEGSFLSKNKIGKNKMTEKMHNYSIISARKLRPAARDAARRLILNQN